MNSDFPIERIMEACHQFVLSRQTQDGAFCYYLDRPWGVEEPNAKDTYAAVAILKMLGRPVPHAAKCTRWLLAQQELGGSYSTLVIGHAVLRALRIIGVEPLHDPRPFIRTITHAQSFTDPAGLEFSGWLANAVRSAELCHDFDVTINEEMREKMQAWLGQYWCEDGGLGSPRSNLLDTGLAAELSVSLRLPVHPQALDYARRCESSPFGFNLTPNCATSSLEIQRAGLQILACFDACPANPSVIRGYAASCQTALGGFGRVPGAIPGLVESQCALEVLSTTLSHCQISG